MGSSAYEIVEAQNIAKNAGITPEFFEPTRYLRIVPYSELHFLPGAMTGSSNKAVYNGVIPPKPSHKFTSLNPPPCGTLDEESLRNYHLKAYTIGPSSVPLASIADSSNTQPIRQEALTSELSDIISRLA